MDMDNINENMNFSVVNSALIINASRHVDSTLIEEFSRNRKIHQPACYILSITYTILIAVGSIGNILVVITVVRNQLMRTVRNIFILNLAISDLLLCLVTMPLTLMEILTKYWPFGKQEFLCRMIGTLQATSIFVSTISITAIALDRYQVIVYPTRDNLRLLGAFGIICAIWLLALVLASPMFFFKTLNIFNIPLEQYGIGDIAYCIEDWPMEHGRIYYSALSLFVQYLLPIIFVSAAYIRIYRKLQNRIPVGVSAAYMKSDQRYVRERRMRRRNRLLISIAVIFAISWLPLNIFNLYADIYLANRTLTQPILIIYAICHMTGMSSACSNPLLYGWLNENFRKEFKDLLFRKSKRSNVALANETGTRNKTTVALSQTGQNLRGKSNTVETTQFMDNKTQAELTLMIE